MFEFRHHQHWRQLITNLIRQFNDASGRVELSSLNSLACVFLIDLFEAIKLFDFGRGAVTNFVVAELALWVSTIGFPVETSLGGRI